MASENKSNTSLQAESKTPTNAYVRADQLANEHKTSDSKTEHHQPGSQTNLRRSPSETPSKSTTLPQQQHSSMSNQQSQSRLQVQQPAASQNHTPSPTIQSTSSTTQLSTTSPPLQKNSLPPIQTPQQSKNQPQNSVNLQPTLSNKTNSNSSLLSNRRPHRLEPLDTSNRSPSQSVIKPLRYYGGPNNSKSTESIKRTKQNTSSSLDANGSKKIVRWHLWWDRSQSNLRVPSYDLPSKNVAPRIDAFNAGYKPGGGNMSILNEKLEWNRKARIDHIAKGYKPGGGNMTILNEKLQWNTESKIGSLANIHHKPAGGNISIIDMPFDKSTARSKIDSGFIFEELSSADLEAHGYETSQYASSSNAWNQSTGRDQH